MVPPQLEQTRAWCLHRVCPVLSWVNPRQSHGQAGVFWKQNWFSCPVPSPTERSKRSGSYSEVFNAPQADFVQVKPFANHNKSSLGRYRLDQRELP